MKTIALAPAFAVAILAAGNLPLQASDLSFAFAALSSNSRAASANVQQRAMSRAVVPAPAPAAEVAPTPMFGAYLSEGEAGLEVARVIPGSPASGVVQSGDIIRTITVLGRPTTKLATLNQFEYAKRKVGENRPAVLEVFRPGTGNLHVWASFNGSGSAVSTAVSAR